MARVLVDSEVEEIKDLCNKTIQKLGRFNVDHEQHAINVIEDAAERAQRILNIIEGRGVTRLQAVN